MKIFLLSILVLGFTACSSHHHNTVEHHHQFGKKCAYEVGQEHFDVEGKEEFKVEHSGDIYYFSSEEKMNKFKADLPNNISMAKEKWRMGRFKKQ